MLPLARAIACMGSWMVGSGECKLDNSFYCFLIPQLLQSLPAPMSYYDWLSQNIPLWGLFSDYYTAVPRREAQIWQFPTSWFLCPCCTIYVLYAVRISVPKNFKTTIVCHLMVNIFFPPSPHSAISTANPRTVYWHLKPRKALAGVNFTLGNVNVSWGILTSEKSTSLSTESEFMQRRLHLSKWWLRIELKLLCTSFFYSNSVHNLMSFY